MAAVRNNIATNLFAGFWTTVLTAAITPLQVKMLGIEAYGLIGFIATLQIVFSAFDLGLATTLTRELASDQSTDRRQSGALIRTASTVYWGIALLVGTILALAAGRIAHDWFNAKTIPASTLRDALYLIVLYLALRWPTALYVGILGGLQRMVAINVVKIAIVTIRLAGGIVVLLIWRDITTFLVWNAATALLEVLAYFLLCRRLCPFASWRPGISIVALRPLMGFSSIMMAISLLALLISQLDRILISKLLSLEQFGFYMLAVNAASITSLAIAAVATAMLPAFAAWQTNPQIAVLQARYDYANRVILFVVGAAAFALICFGQTILTWWVGGAAAAGAYQPMALLAAALWLNALVSNAYTTSVALGRPGLTLRVSALSALPYALVLYFMIRQWHTVGAAAAWLLLNLSYVLTLVPIVHRDLLKISTVRWFKNTLLPFAALGMGSFGTARVARDMWTAGGTITDIVAIGAGGGLYFLIGYRLLGPRIRNDIVRVLDRRLRTADAV